MITLNKKPLKIAMYQFTNFHPSIVWRGILWDDYSFDGWPHNIPKIAERLQTIHIINVTKESHVEHHEK